MKSNRNSVLSAFSRMMDFLQGESHVDNTKNPASAHSQLMRKQKHTEPRDVQDEKLTKNP